MSTKARPIEIRSSLSLTEPLPSRYAKHSVFARIASGDRPDPPTKMPSRVVPPQSRPARAKESAEEKGARIEKAVQSYVPVCLCGQRAVKRIVQNQTSKYANRAYWKCASESVASGGDIQCKYWQLDDAVKTDRRKTVQENRTIEEFFG